MSAWSLLFHGSSQTPASVWSPTDLADIAVLYDAATTWGKTGSGIVATWPDLGPTSNDAANSTTAQQPLLVACSTGVMCPQWDGADDHMTITEDVALAPAGDFTFAVVFNVYDQGLRSLFFAANIQWGVCSASSGVNVYDNFQGHFPSATPIAENSMMLLIEVFDHVAETHTLYINGTQAAQSTGVTLTPETETCTVASIGDSYVFCGLTGLYLAQNAVMSEGDRESLLAYCQAEYGVPT